MDATEKPELTKTTRVNIFFVLFYFVYFILFYFFCKMVLLLFSGKLFNIYVYELAPGLYHDVKKISTVKFSVIRSSVVTSLHLADSLKVTT